MPGVEVKLRSAPVVYLWHLGGPSADVFKDLQSVWHLVQMLLSDGVRSRARMELIEESLRRSATFAKNKKRWRRS